MQLGDLRVRLLAEESQSEAEQVLEGGEKRIHSLELRREGVLTYGFTQGCLGCQATLAETARQGHVEMCHGHMEEAIRSSPEGQAHAFR